MRARPYAYWHSAQSANLNWGASTRTHAHACLHALRSCPWKLLWGTASSGRSGMVLPCQRQASSRVCVRACKHVCMCTCAYLCVCVFLCQLKASQLLAGVCLRVCM